VFTTSRSLQPVLLVTRSAGKRRELAALFAQAGIAVETLTDALVPESPEEASLEVHATFEDNALAKAKHFAARTGRVVVADDSGLCVDALDGRPGVHSKRWSGRDDLDGLELDAVNNRFLLDALHQAAARGRAERTAHYVCAAAAAWPDGDSIGCVVAMGHTAGVMLEVPRGEGGFGYDPYFASSPLGGRTFAEVTREEKASVSHRGAAVMALLGALRGHAVLSTLVSIADTESGER
jgi:XTP/dITP diphosphohydrolase